jgi:phosphate transport system substrate-binding protein
MKRCHVILLTGLVLMPGGCSGCGGGGGDGKAVTRLEGAGSTFIDPMMQLWAKTYDKEKKVQINYQGGGSGHGIKMMTNREVDFGCSDAPMNEEQLAKAKDKDGGGEVLHIPLCMGAIVLAYNLPGVDDLILDGKVLTGIYMGKITKWNDKAIGALNQGKKLPDKDISVAYRSDSSGSTYIFTDYLSKVEKEAWKPGKSTAIRFPIGTGSKGTDAVAGAIKANEGTIGYIELIYALNNKIPFATINNAAGKPIRADMKSVTAAAAGAAKEIPDDLRYSITNAPGDEAYPIAGTTWALVYAKQPADKVKPLAALLTWMTHEGQKQCEKLHYASLPQVLVAKIEAKIKKIEPAGK